MRFTTALFAAVVLSVALGCGKVDDPNPEKLDTPLTMEAGELIVADVRSDDEYPELSHDFEWEVDLDSVPAGFVYRTLDIWLDGRDRVWVEFELLVSSEVPEGRYGFDAEYELWNYGQLFNQQVEFQFDVLVLEPHVGPGADHLVIQGVREVAPVEEETAEAPLLILIGEM